MDLFIFINLKATDMRWLLVSFVVFIIIGCGDSSQPKDVSTVDPNVQGQVDSIPMEMLSDSLNETIALDSVGPTIHPEDTNYNRK